MVEPPSTFGERCTGANAVWIRRTRYAKFVVFPHSPAYHDRRTLTQSLSLVWSVKAVTVNTVSTVRHLSPGNRNTGLVNPCNAPVNPVSYRGMLARTRVLQG